MSEILVPVHHDSSFSGVTAGWLGGRVCHDGPPGERNQHGEGREGIRTNSFHRVIILVVLVGDLMLDHLVVNPQLLSTKYDGNRVHEDVTFRIFYPEMIELGRTFLLQDTFAKDNMLVHLMVEQEGSALPL